MDSLLRVMHLVMSVAHDASSSWQGQACQCRCHKAAGNAIEVGVARQSGPCISPPHQNFSRCNLAVPGTIWQCRLYHFNPFSNALFGLCNDSVCRSWHCPRDWVHARMLLARATEVLHCAHPSPQRFYELLQPRFQNCLWLPHTDTTPWIPQQFFAPTAASAWKLMMESAKLSTKIQILLWKGHQAPKEAL